jgi:hypothetical protein
MVLQRFQRLKFFDFPLQYLQAIPRSANKNREAQERQPVDQEDMQHSGIDRASAPNDRLRMLGSKNPDGEINQGHIERPENCQRSRQNWSLTTRREPAQH